MLVVILYFLFCSLVCILVHELGHYLAARLCNIKIKEFSVGFGNVLYSYLDSKQTLWKFCLLPLGGYVKPDIQGTDDELDFILSIPLLKRVFFLANGALFNFGLAIILIASMMLIWGERQVRNEFFLIRSHATPVPITDFVIDSQKQNFVLQIGNNQQYSYKFSDSISFQKALVNLTKVSSDQIEVSLDSDVSIIKKVLVNYKSYNLFTAVYLGAKISILYIKNMLSFLFYNPILETTAQLRGPIGIMHDISGKLLQFSCLELLIQLSLGIGVLNLFIPIVPLDGGLIFLSCLANFIPTIYRKGLIRIFSYISIAIFIAFVLYINFKDLERFFLY